MTEVYEHYHVSIDTKEGMIELLVEKRMSTVANGDYYYVIDDWGEITGTPENIMARFETAKDAVAYAIKELKKKYPNGRLVYGAGCPPKEWLE